MKRTICLLTCCFAVFFLGSSCSKSKSERSMSDDSHIQKSSITIDGLTWATCNVGATNRSNRGKLFTYDMALQSCPEGWRLPTRDEIETIMSLFTHFGEYVDYHIWGLFFTGSSPEGDSVFLPCAGYNYGAGHKGLHEYGCYWLSTGDYFVFCSGHSLGVGGTADPLGGMHSGQYSFLAPDGICAFSVRCVKN